MSLILDATAGNRMMWPNKNPPNTVFMDKRGPELKIPPDIIAVWEYAPFRDDAFSCVIFDPPHLVRSKPPPRMGKTYGFFRTHIEMITAIRKAQKEFARIAARLCFKWWDDRDDRGSTLWKLLVFFDMWQLIYKRDETRVRVNRRDLSSTWWATFTRKEKV